MTGEHFITNDPYGYSRIFYDGSRLDNKKVCKKLNALNEENEQLEEAREYYQENFLTMKTERNQFKRENEQLKLQMLNIEEDMDYFKSKASSLEEGYIKLQDQEIRLKKENGQLKAQLKDCEKRVTDKEVEWLRNNTVWEQMPSNKRTYTTTNAKEDYK